MSTALDAALESLRSSRREFEQALQQRPVVVNSGSPLTLGRRVRISRQGSVSIDLGTGLADEKEGAEPSEEHEVQAMRRLLGTEEGDGRGDVADQRSCRKCKLLAGGYGAQTR